MEDVAVIMMHPVCMNESLSRMWELDRVPKVKQFLPLEFESSVLDRNLILIDYEVQIVEQ